MLQSPLAIHYFGLPLHFLAKDFTTLCKCVTSHCFHVTNGKDRYLASNGEHGMELGEGSQAMEQNPWLPHGFAKPSSIQVSLLTDVSRAAG